MAAEIKLYFDNEPADAARLDLFGEIRVDQAIGLVTEAQLEMALSLDSSGNWTDFGESFLQPGTRVRVEVKPGEGEFAPLIDGSIVGQRFELSATPNESKLVVVVHDDSVLLNREEKVEIYEEKSASDIATLLFNEQSFELRVDSVPAAGSALERTVVQRGTGLQLLRSLARQHGMFMYVEPGTTVGKSIGVFATPKLEPTTFPELLLLGDQRNVNQLGFEVDGLRPSVARASSITISDQTVQSSEIKISSDRALGDVASHQAVTPGKLLLARTREESSDVSAAATASANHSSWAYSASGEVDATTYRAVLSPYRLVNVSGAGHLSGEYLVSKVVHVITDEGYKQQFGLRRNAHSELTQSSAPGGLF